MRPHGTIKSNRVIILVILFALAAGAGLWLLGGTTHTCPPGEVWTQTGVVNGHGVNGCR